MQYELWEINLSLMVSWALFGLIWVIQLTHYPTFQFIAEDKFSAFHHHHTQSITLIVLPLMVTELALAAWLVYHYQFRWLDLTVLIIVLLIWASTFFISVPLHNTLADGKDSQIINKLVQTNWIRTFLWTLKGVLITYFSFKSL